MTDSIGRDRRMKSPLVPAARFAGLTAIGFVVLVLVALGEILTLRIIGVRYMPKSSLIGAGVSGFSVSADGSLGVTVASLAVRPFDSGLEYDLVLREFPFERQVPLHLNRLHPRCVAMAPMADEVTLGCADGSIYAYRLPPNNVSRCDKFDHSDSAGRLRLLHSVTSGDMIQLNISPDGNYLAAVSDREICLLKLPGGELLSSWRYDIHDCVHVLVAFSGDSGRLLSYSGGDFARLCSTITGEQLAAIPLPVAGLWGLALSTDGYIATLVGGDCTVRAWSFETGDVLWCHQLPTFSTRGSPMSVSANGKFMATFGSLHTVDVYDLGAGKLMRQFESDNGPINGCVFGLNCRLYAWDNQGTIHNWNVDRTGDRFQVNIQKRPERALAIEPSLSTRPYCGSSGAAIETSRSTSF